MGRALETYRDPPPVVEPQAVTSVGPPAQCTIIGDITGNNFHGNYACFDIGMQIGNPAQYGKMSGGGFTGGGGQIFMGFGPPPPLSYDRQGLGTAPPAQPLGQTGSFYFQVDTGSIWWNSGSTWTQKI